MVSEDGVTFINPWEVTPEGFIPEIVRYSHRSNHADTCPDFTDDPDSCTHTQLSYGDWEHDPTGYLWLPQYLGGSDYSGDSVTVANHRVFLKEFGEQAGVWDVRGGHGTYAIAIDLRKPYPRALLDTFMHIKDYLVIDEVVMTEVESECENNAWDSWCRSDFTRDLRERGIITEEERDGLDDDKVWELFREMADSANTYWQHETGCQAYIDLEQVIERSTHSLHDMRRALGLPDTVQCADEDCVCHAGEEPKSDR